jgi:hypothetical protein
MEFHPALTHQMVRSGCQSGSPRCLQNKDLQSVEGCILFQSMRVSMYKSCLLMTQSAAARSLQTGAQSVAEKGNRKLGPGIADL